MSGVIMNSSFAPTNDLYDAAKVSQNIQGYQHNQLLMQQTQQTLDANQTEYAARAAGVLLGITDPAARAAAYPGIVSALPPSLRARAPATLPDEQTLRGLAALGTPSADIYKLGVNASGVDSYGQAVGIGRAAASAPGSGTAAAPGGGFTGDREHDRALIVAKESGGDPTALNYVAKADPTAYARGATASGKYQFVNDTWRDGMKLAGLDPAQYPTARDAPEAVQDQVFNAVYARDGFKPWQKGAKDWIKDENGRYQLATVRPQLATPPAAPGGGVVARNPGAVQVAGPGAPTAAAAPVAPPAATTDLVGPRPLPPTSAGAPVATPESIANTPYPVARNALAGPPAPVTTAQAQPPAAAPAAPPAAPPAPTTAMPAALQTDDHNLTERDKQELKPLFDAARRGQIPLAQLQNEVQQRQMANLARQDKWQAQQHQAMEDQRQREADARAAETLRLSQEDDKRKAVQLQLSQAADQRAAEKAAQEAKAANKPVQGNDVDAQHESYLYEHANEIRDGTASEEVKRQYAGSYYALQQRGGQALQITDPNNPGGTIAATITRRLPPSLPEPPGGALPEVLTTPGAAKAPQMTEPQSQAAGFADRMQNALPIITDTSPAAMSRWQQLLGKIPLAGNSFVSSEFQQHIQAERDFINAVLRKESGAAISESEFVNARQQYIPQPGDGAAVLAQKAKNRETVLANLTRDAGPAYKPPTTATSSAAAVPPPPKGFKVIQ